MRDSKKMIKILKEIYKNKPSIFVDNVEEILNDDTRVNRYDEYLLKQIGIGYMMMALNNSPEITKKLTKKDINNLIYTIVCYMDSCCEADAIEESYNYDLSV